MKDLILKALNKHSYFIGIHQLCRFLNNKGYIRYGCNAKYKKDINNKKTIKINPCNSLCKNSKIYKSKIYYWIEKMTKSNELFSILIKFKDFKNPFVNTEKHKTYDIFKFISLNKNIYLDFKRNNDVIEI